MQAEVIGIPPIDPMLGQQILSFLKGLAGPGMLPPTQALTNPLVARNVPQIGELGGNDAFFGLCWVL